MNTGRRLSFMTLLSVLTLSSCGKIIPQDILDLEHTYPIKIIISIDTYIAQDPQISIKARDLTIDREKMIITIKDGLISDGPVRFHLIKFSGEISFPLNGSRISIWKDGKYELIEDYRDPPRELPPATK
ncbi:MAG: hypothetical protein AAB784_00530 [Patescibacteria group bacterium]